MRKKYTYNDAYVESTIVMDGCKAIEAHLIAHVSNPLLNYRHQLEAIEEALSYITKGEMANFSPVFIRYFVSDAANQTELINNSELNCARSVVEQPPLNGTKVAVWCYLMAGVTTTALENGLFAVDQGQYRHLWGGSAHNFAKNSEEQTLLLFEEYEKQLADEGCTLADNCLRTWFFVNDVDLNYGGVVRARNSVFALRGLTADTHFIASTGIGGRQADPNVLAQMDTYAVKGLRKEQVKYLYAPTHLNRTSEYGVSFERGTAVEYHDRRHVFISGTASIDNRGQIVHEGDIVNQTDRMTENVGVLLREAGCSYDDVTHIIVYLRDIADYQIVMTIMKRKFPYMPIVIVHAPVCRPGWLIEMECMAVKKIEN